MAQTGSLIPIYTIGYGARSLEAFLAVLKSYEIGYLIDVRSAPYSKFKPEFSRRELEAAVQAAGIRYVFMGESLGGKPDDPDCYEDDKVIYERVREKAFYRQGIDRVQAAFERQLRIVLMCSEGKPEQCHRSKLLGETLVATGIPVVHIDEKDDARTHAEVIERLTGGQLGLFGQQEFTSRKRYGSGEEKTDA
jgi:uncharacterized protein (DUF488 family)